MDLTNEQILEMTETIAQACGFHCERIKSHVYRVEMLSGEEESFSIFDPFESWDDAFMAAEAMGFVAIDFAKCKEGGWWCTMQTMENVTHSYSGNMHESAFESLHEAAKAKLEGYQNEDGN